MEKITSIDMPMISPPTPTDPLISLFTSQHVELPP